MTLDNGKRLDSYDPPDSIVSRKNRQFDAHGDHTGVKDKTAFSYIAELVRKYGPEQKINGENLVGELVLEVSVQDSGGLRREILEYATRSKVIIRDVLGNDYN